MRFVPITSIWRKIQAIDHLLARLDHLIETLGVFALDR